MGDEQQYAEMIHELVANNKLSLEETLKYLQAIKDFNDVIKEICINHMEDSTKQSFLFKMGE